MASTLVLDPPTAKPSGDGTRFVSVRANLLPDEVVSARQLEVTRKQVVLGLLIVVALLIAWFGFSWWQTSLANSNLDDAQHRTIALQNQQSEFAPLVSAQNESNLIRRELHLLMAADLPWTTMLASLRSVAPAGVTITNVTAALSASGIPGANSAGAGVALNAGALNQSGKPTIGQLSVTGTAGTKNAVAAYADRLAGIRGLTAPLVTNVAATTGTVTFTVNVLVTTDALGGRFAAPVAPPTTGGK